MIGSTLSGRYKVSTVLGAGGMGRTYVAHDTLRPGHPTCVVKQLKPASDDAGVLEIARRLFATEAEILERLGNHDQVPRLLAYFEQEQEFYLVQEFIDGHPLSFELPQGQTWSEERVIVLLQEILSVLSFIHAQNVIHRDIKPDNIIRRQRDQKLVLIDFGAVKQVRLQQPTIVGQASVTVAIGTPGYMPTEQSSGKPRPSSDIYAVGMIGIQALTGMMPTYLHEDDDGEVVWQHLTQVSDGLAQVINKMVRHYFKHRYQSATEALQALQELTNAPPLSTTSADLAATQLAAGWSSSRSAPYSAPFASNGSPVAPTPFPTVPSSPPTPYSAPQAFVPSVPSAPTGSTASTPSIPPTQHVPVASTPSIPPTQAVSPTMPANPSMPPTRSVSGTPATHVANGGSNGGANGGANGHTPTPVAKTPLVNGQAFRPGNPLYAPNPLVAPEQQVLTTPMPNQGAIALQPGTQVDKSSPKFLLIGGGIALLLLVGGAVYAVMFRGQQPTQPTPSTITAPSTPEASPIPSPDPSSPSPSPSPEVIPSPAAAPAPAPAPAPEPVAAPAPAPYIPPPEPEYIPPEPAYVPEPEPYYPPVAEPYYPPEPAPAPAPAPAAEEVPFFEVPDF